MSYQKNNERKSYQLENGISKDAAKSVIKKNIKCYYTEADPDDFDLDSIFKENYIEVAESIYYRTSGIKGFLKSIAFHYDGVNPLEDMANKGYSELIKIRNDYRDNNFM